MIFVTVGTNEARFDRLLAALDALPGGEELVVQHGPSPLRPAGAACVDFLPFGGLVEHVRRARVVITHAGVGSIMVCLANERRPLVMPRLRAQGEAVDDHQVGLAERLERAGLVRMISDGAGLALAAAEDGASGERRPPATRLRDDLATCLSSPGPRARGTLVRRRRRTGTATTGATDARV